MVKPSVIRGLMFAQIGIGRAALSRPPAATWAFATLAAAAVVLVVLQSCSPLPPSPLVGTDPSDPQAKVRPTVYKTTVGADMSQRPVEPVPWREQSKDAAPPAKP